MRFQRNWKLALCLVGLLISTFLVSAALAEDTVTLTVNGGSSVTVNIYDDDLTYVATAPGADHIALWSDEDIQEYSQAPDENGQVTWTKPNWEGGTYQVFAVATWADGHSVASAPVSVNIICDGYLPLPEVHFPAVLQPGDNLNVTYNTLDGYSDVRYWFEVSTMEGESIFNESHNDATPFSVDGNLFTTNTSYNLEFGDNAPGYRDSHMYGVVYIDDGNASSSVHLWLDNSQEDIYKINEYDMDVHIEFGADENGNAPTAVELRRNWSTQDGYKDWGEWKSWLQTGEIYTTAGIDANSTALYCVFVTYDEFDPEQEDWSWNVNWIRSNLISVASYRYDNTPLQVPAFALENTNVSRGQWIWVNYLNLDPRATSYEYRIFEGDVDDNTYLYSETHSADNPSIGFSTAALQVGHMYRLEVEAYSDDGMSRCGNVFFTVTGEPSDYTFDHAWNEIRVQESAPIYGVFPGASNVELYQDGQFVEDADYGSDYVFYQFQAREAGTYTFTVVVTYPDGTVRTFDGGNAKAIIATSDGRVSTPSATGTAYINAGLDYTVSITPVDNVKGYNVWLDEIVQYADEFDTDRNVYHVYLNADDDLTITYPSSVLKTNRAYRVNIEPEPVNGYEYPYRNGVVEFVVLQDWNSGSMYFDIDGSEIVDSMPYVETVSHGINYFTASAPGATAIRVFSGTDNQDYWYYQIWALNAEGCGEIKHSFEASDLKGDTVMYAEYTTDPVPENPSDEDWRSLNWSGPSAPVRLHITSNEEYANLEYSISPENEVSRGDFITVTIDNPDYTNGTDYVAAMFRVNEQTGENEDWCGDFVWNYGGEIYIPTGYLPEGTYSLEIRHRIDEYYETRKWNRISVFEDNDIPYSFITNKDEVTAREEYRVSGWFKNAVRIELFDNGDCVGEWDGDCIPTDATWRADEPGEHMFSARATYADGSQITTTDIGRDFKVTVTAEAGKLGYPVLEGPNTIQEGQDYKFSFTRVDNAATYEYIVVDENDKWIYTSDGEQLPDALLTYIPGSVLEAGHTYRLYMFARQGKYQSADYRREFLVLTNGEDELSSGNPDIWFTVWGDKGDQEFQINEEFLMWVSAPNATGLRASVLGDPNYHPTYGTDTLQPYDLNTMVWEGSWSFDDPGVYGLYWQYTTDEINDDTDWDTLTWSDRSNVIFITVTGEGVYEEPVYTVPETVTRGENLTIGVNLTDERADASQVHIYASLYNDGNWADGGGETDWDISNGSVSIPTANLEPGEYTLELYAEAVGYQYVRTYYKVNVTDTEAEITFSLTPDTISVGKELAWFSVYAPGADRIHMYEVNGDDEWEIQNWDGDTMVFGWAWNDAGEHTYYAVADFGDETKTTERRTLTVTANKGKLGDLSVSVEQLFVKDSNSVFEYDFSFEPDMSFANDEERDAWLNTVQFEAWVEDVWDNYNWVYTQGRKLGSGSIITAIPNDVLVHGRVYRIVVQAYLAGYESARGEAKFAVIDPDLSYLDMPDMLETIEEEAFDGIGAEHIYIGSNVQSVGPRAFADNVNTLQLVEIEGNPDIDPSAFEDCGWFAVIWNGEVFSNREKDWGN